MLIQTILQSIVGPLIWGVGGPASSNEMDKGRRNFSCIASGSHTPSFCYIQIVYICAKHLVINWDTRETFLFGSVTACLS